MPLKYVVKDASGNEQELSNNKLFVNFDIKELVSSNDNVIGTVNTKPLGTKIDRKGIRLSYYGSIYRNNLRPLIDSDENTFCYFRSDAYLYFNLPKVRSIKAIVIKVDKTTVMKQLSAYAALVQGAEQMQGTASFTGEGKFVITFKNPVVTNRLALGNFVEADNLETVWMGISDVQFYEEE